MRKSLLSFFHLALASCAAALANVLPTTLTPGIGAAPKIKPHQRYRRHDAPAASLSAGKIRHHATSMFRAVSNWRPRDNFQFGQHSYAT